MFCNLASIILRECDIKNTVSCANLPRYSLARSVYEHTGIHNRSVMRIGRSRFGSFCPIGSARPMYEPRFEHQLYCQPAEWLGLIRKLLP